jgi:hypothetical protein
VVCVTFLSGGGLVEPSAASLRLRATTDSACGRLQVAEVCAAAVFAVWKIGRGVAAAPCMSACISKATGKTTLRHCVTCCLHCAVLHCSVLRVGPAQGQAGAAAIPAGSAHR